MRHHHPHTKQNRLCFNYTLFRAKTERNILAIESEGTRDCGPVPVLIMHRVQVAQIPISLAGKLQNATGGKHSGRRWRGGVLADAAEVGSQVAGSATGDTRQNVTRLNEEAKSTLHTLVYSSTDDVSLPSFLSSSLSLTLTHSLIRFDSWQAAELGVPSNLSTQFRLNAELHIPPWCQPTTLPAFTCWCREGRVGKKSRVASRQIVSYVLRASCELRVAVLTLTCQDCHHRVLIGLRRQFA